MCKFQCCYSSSSSKCSFPAKQEQQQVPLARSLCLSQIRLGSHPNTMDCDNYTQRPQKHSKGIKHHTHTHTKAIASACDLVHALDAASGQLSALEQIFNSRRSTISSLQFAKSQKQLAISATYNVDTLTRLAIHIESWRKFRLI